ncbi:MAG TPA: AAA family ATPase [Hyphomicrobiaceae bacterium]|nr:AAA family ATPase [Hyphomicrobiaceae bacterium]
MAQAQPADPAVQRNGQSEVIDFLSEPNSYSGVDRVDRFETHGNLVFLAGSEAWKIKRAVRLAYMDFSTLEKRHAACVREVEINRRFGSDLYLGCLPIARSAAGALVFGGNGQIVEWAVRMRRFDQSALLSVIADQTGVSRDLARALAEAVHQAHQRAEPVTCSGTIALGELATSISTTLGQSAIACPELALLARGLREQIGMSAAALEERAARGFVRRCHGDLHLANIVMSEGRPALYDAIEFDEAIATIDTLYDLAFLLMDLDRHKLSPAANAVLNHYLWLSAEPLDLRGLIALPLFLALRAAVRAMVMVDRAGQERGEARERDLEQAHTYLRAALDYLKQPPPQLVAIGGLSGTGKTAVATSLAPWLGPAPGAIHLRTDLERKRLAGVPEVQRLPHSAYAPEARKRVYQVLSEKARLVLSAGHAVIIDAVFADPDVRQDVQALAREAGVPFQGIWLHDAPETLLKRVAERRNDASDATREVVCTQLKGDHGPLTAEWTVVDAGGTLVDTLARARAALKGIEGRGP